MKGRCGLVVLDLSLLVLLLLAFTLAHRDGTSKLDLFRRSEDKGLHAGRLPQWHPRQRLRRNPTPSTFDDDDDGEDEEEDGEDEDEGASETKPPITPSLETDTDDPQGVFHTLESLREMKPGPGVLQHTQMPLHTIQQTPDEDDEVQKTKTGDETSNERSQGKRKRSPMKKNWVKGYKVEMSKNGDDLNNESPKSRGGGSHRNRNWLKYDEVEKTKDGENPNRISVESFKSRQKRSQKKIKLPNKHDDPNEQSSVKYNQAGYYNNGVNVNDKIDIKRHIKNTRNATADKIPLVTKPTPAGRSDFASLVNEDKAKAPLAKSFDTLSDDTKPSLDRTKSSFDRTKSSFDRTKSSFDRNKSSFDRTKPSFDRTKTSFGRTKPVTLNRDRRQIVSTSTDGDNWVHHVTTNTDDSDEDGDDNYSNDNDYTHTINFRRVEKKPSRVVYQTHSIIDPTGENKINFVHHVVKIKPSKKDLMAQRWLEKELRTIELESKAIQKKADILNHKMKGVNLVKSSRRRPILRIHNEKIVPGVTVRHEHQHIYNFPRPTKMKLRLISLENELRNLRTKMRAQDIYDLSGADDDDGEEGTRVITQQFTNTDKNNYDDDEDEDEEEQKRYKRSVINPGLSGSGRGYTESTGSVQSHPVRAIRSESQDHQPSTFTKDLQRIYGLLKSENYRNKQMADKLRKDRLTAPQTMKGKHDDRKPQGNKDSTVHKSTENIKENKNTFKIKGAQAVGNYATYSKKRNPQVERNVFRFNKAANPLESYGKDYEGRGMTPDNKGTGNTRFNFKNNHLSSHNNNGAIPDSTVSSPPQSQRLLSHDNFRSDDRKISDTIGLKINEHTNAPYKVALTIKWLEILNKTWPPRTAAERAMAETVLDKINVMTDDPSKGPARRHKNGSDPATSPPYYHSDKLTNAVTKDQSKRYFVRKPKLRNRVSQIANRLTHEDDKVQLFIDKLLRSDPVYSDMFFDTPDQRAESQQKLAEQDDVPEIDSKFYNRGSFDSKHKQLKSHDSNNNADKQKSLLESRRTNDALKTLSAHLHKCHRKVEHLTKSLAALRRQRHVRERSGPSFENDVKKRADSTFDRMNDGTVKQKPNLSRSLTSLKLLNQEAKLDQTDRAKSGATDIKAQVYNKPTSFEKSKVVKNQQFHSRESPNSPFKNGEQYGSIKNDQMRMRPENLLDIFGESRRRKRAAPSMAKNQKRSVQKDKIDEIKMKEELVSLLSRLPSTETEDRAKQSLKREDEELRNSASVARAILRLQDEEDADSNSGVLLAESWQPLLRKRRASPQDHIRHLKAKHSKKTISQDNKPSKKPDIYLNIPLKRDRSAYESNRVQKRHAQMSKNGNPGSDGETSLDEYLHLVAEETRRLAHQGLLSVNKPHDNQKAPDGDDFQGLGPYSGDPQDKRRAYDTQPQDGYRAYDTYPQDMRQGHDTKLQDMRRRAYDTTPQDRHRPCDTGTQEGPRAYDTEPQGNSQAYAPLTDDHLDLLERKYKSRSRRDVDVKAAPSDYFTEDENFGEGDDDAIDIESFFDDNDIEDDPVVTDNDDGQGYGSLGEAKIDRRRMRQKKMEKVEVKENGRDVPEEDDFVFVEKKSRVKPKTESYSWGSWSPCSVTCGLGERFRSNLCDQGQPCTGKDASTEIEICSEKDTC